MKKLKWICSVCLTACLLAVGCLTFAGCGEVYKVTFDFNYEGAPAAVVQEVKSGEKAETPDEPKREGYVFDGWSTSADGTGDYAFDAVKGDATVYARWKDDPNFVSVTFDLGEGGDPVIVKVKKEDRVAAPEIEREGFEAVGWYKDEALESEYNFQLLVNAPLTLYAKWVKQHTFEAEYCDCIRDMTGPGWSGNAENLAMIIEDKFGTASNGYFVSYLYQRGMTLKFTVNSDVAVKKARLKVRLSTQYIDLNLTSAIYRITVNNVGQGYDAIKINHDPGDMTNSGMTPFKDYLICEVDLIAGENVITLMTDNDMPTAGSTMKAHAPVVDCIKITADANLTWTKDYNGKNLEDAGFIV